MTERERGRRGRIPEVVDVLVRRTDEYGEPATEVLSARIRVGTDSAVVDLADDVERWLLQDRGLMGFEVETRQVRVHAGAEGFGEDLIIAFFGAGGGVALQEVWSYLKSRFGANDSETIDTFAWLSQLDPSDAADQVRSQVARAMDRSSADLTIVELERRDNSLHAVLSASSGQRYVIDVDSDGCSLVTSEAEPRG